MSESNSRYMDLAISEALKAWKKSEVPIGAVIVSEKGNILAAAHNETITLKDPTAHAELRAIRQAAGKVGNYRLLNTILYVTIEPCIMCMGAIIHARIAKLVFGAPDPKWGAAGSLYDLAQDSRLNHQPSVRRGIQEEKCRQLLQSFFRLRRIGKNAANINPPF